MNISDLKHSYPYKYVSFSTDFLIKTIDTAGARVQSSLMHKPENFTP